MIWPKFTSALTWPQPPPADYEASQAEHEPDRAERDDQHCAQHGPRRQRGEVQRVQRLVEPAIGSPRGIGFLRERAVACVDVVPDSPTDDALDWGVLTDRGDPIIILP